MVNIFKYSLRYVLKLYPKPQVNPTRIHVKRFFGAKVQRFFFSKKRTFFDCFSYREQAGPGVGTR